MNPEHQLAPDGQSERAAKAAKQATAGNGKPFYGEGMHQGNSVPRGTAKTNTQPLKGATPPTVLNPMQRPGQGASNPAKRGVI
jgi:hypothetical protein